MEISERIKKRRLELGLTLEDVADKLGVAKSTVLRYETKAIGNMGLDKLELLAVALHCTPAYLMGWDIERVDNGYSVKENGNEYQAILKDITKGVSDQELIEIIKHVKGLIKDQK